MELTGKVILVKDLFQVTDTFKKREFVVETQETNNDQTYTQQIILQTIQAKTSMLDNISEGQDVTVQFNIQGKGFEKDGVTRYFNNLNAWKIEVNDNF
jgi:single-strand DNA-binding protein